MNGDPGGGFFAPQRSGPVAGASITPGSVPAVPGLSAPSHLQPPPPDPSSRIGHTASVRREERAPFLGILACALAATGLAITMLGGNQGGLIGMPVLLLGGVLGGVAWATGFGRIWGKVAVATIPVFSGLAVLSEVLRIAT